MRIVSRRSGLHVAFEIPETPGLLACILLLLSLASPARAEGPPLAVELAPGRVTYSLALDECVVSLAHIRQGPDTGLLTYDTSCRLSPARELAGLEVMLDELLRARFTAPVLKTLAYGPIAERSSALPLRLARAAHTSPLWDRIEGRPTGGALTGGALEDTILRLSREAGIAAELSRLLATYGYGIEVETIAGVSVEEAGSSAALAPLLSEGIGSAERLPASALLTFEIKPLDAPLPGSLLSIEPSDLIGRLTRMRETASAVVIEAALEREANPGARLDIYRRAYWEIYGICGPGTADPILAAARPLLAEALGRLDLALGVTPEEREWAEVEGPPETQ
jgi:hypothetical protein